MAAVSINWSSYIREAIAERIEREERKRVAQDLLAELRMRRHVVPKGFINQTIREARRAR